MLPTIPTRLYLCGFYFCSYGALGAFFPFLPLLLAGRGFDAVAISWVMVLLPAANLLVPPMWGILADVVAARVALLRLASAAAGLMLLALLPRWSLGPTIAIMALHCIFRAPMAPLADAISHAVLGDQRARFARIRVWGSIGFAICVAGAGWLEVSEQQSPLLLATCGLLLLTSASTSGLPRIAADGPRPRTREALAQLWDPARVLFLLATACYYSGHAMYDAFYSLHLRRLGFEDSFVGLAWSVGVVVEIGLMMLAPPLMRWSKLLLLASALVAASRWWLLSWNNTSAVLLAIQPLHAITFGLWYLSMVKEIQELAPEQLRAAHQSVVTAAMGFGMVTGYLVGGRVMSASGGPQLFWIATVAALGAAGLYAISFMVGTLGRRPKD